MGNSLNEDPVSFEPDEFEDFCKKVRENKETNHQEIVYGAGRPIAVNYPSKEEYKKIAEDCTDPKTADHDWKQIELDKIEGMYIGSVTIVDLFGGLERQINSEINQKVYEEFVREVGDLSIEVSQRVTQKGIDLVITVQENGGAETVADVLQSLGLC